MRFLLVILLNLAVLIGYAQIEKIATELPDYMIPKEDVFHTLKVEVTNNYDKCKLLFLFNNEDVTGIDLSGLDWTNTILFISEYGGTLSLDLESWIPSPFCVWFKKMEPGETFTFYFQSKGNIDTDRLLDCIRFSNNDLCGRTKTMEDLGWKADEIVVYLPVPISDDE